MSDKTDEKEKKTTEKVEKVEKAEKKKPTKKKPTTVKVRVVTLPNRKKGQTIECSPEQAEKWLKKGQVIKA